MPRLEAFELTVKTGARGFAETPRYVMNGFTVGFDQATGGAGPGETLELRGSPSSYPHTLLLRGPEQGPWDIEEIRAVYRLDGEEPYAVRFGAVTLDEESDLNLWRERPPLEFDV